MMNVLLEEYGGHAVFAERKLKTFFSPEEALTATEEHLRQKCRLGYRARFFLPYAKFFSRNDDDNLREQPSETVVTQLRDIYGVGPYTANVIASHALRDDAAVPLDVWNRKIFARRLGLRSSTPGSVGRAMALRFGALSGIAALYLVESEFLAAPLQPLLTEQATLRRTRS
jgi:3-methyladenine DNA glycosylase/8-oxoguanine DNA glycosylase